MPCPRFPVRASQILGLGSVIWFAAVWLATASAQVPAANQDEAKVPKYELPDPLISADGAPVKSANEWTSRRRPELLRLFETHVYGRVPQAKSNVEFRLAEHSEQALGGKAIRKQVTVLFGGGEDGPRMSLLLYLPAKATKPSPVFLGLNFAGNHAVNADPAILIPQGWMRPGPGIVNNRASEAGRGLSADRWPIEMMLDRGFGVATAYCGDIDPDYHDGFANGVHPLFYKQGQTTPADDEWGTIAAWAWGLSRAMDYLETDPAVDAKHVAVLGHSRLGKTSLWAGAQDQRFALVISNNSGCGGAALSRRAFGETVARINTSFPHWFNANFKQYNNAEDKLPVDQHMLVALIAPRPVFVASAEDDLWADPRGEFLSCVGASPVYKLLGADGFAASEPPPLNEPVMSRIGYYKRPGKHGIGEADWKVFADFAQQHWKR